MARDHEHALVRHLVGVVLVDALTAAHTDERASSSTLDVHRQPTAAALRIDPKNLARDVRRLEREA